MSLVEMGLRTGLIPQACDLGYVHGLGKGRLLGLGGVYIFPFKEAYPTDFSGIVNLSQQQMYFDISNFGALFEIDDAGYIHSHSIFPELNRFDGEYFLVLRDEIEELLELFERQ